MRPHRLVAISLLAVAAGGCAWLPATQGASMLERADRLSRHGDFDEAVVVYGEYLAQYPASDAAARVTASRDTLQALLRARAQVAGAHEELTRSRAELARLREELARLRDDLARRDYDLVRVRQESERLKTDLERLKQIDLKLERRK